MQWVRMLEGVSSNLSIVVFFTVIFKILFSTTILSVSLVLERRSLVRTPGILSVRTPGTTILSVKTLFLV